MDERQTLIVNRYEIQRELGRGGMGVVYRAYDRLEQQHVALKQVLLPASLQFATKPSTNDTINLRLSLAREFSILATLRHPNVISVQDYGFDLLRQPYFTMEFLPEAHIITDYAKTASSHTKIRLLTELLQALTYLHQRRILHRDLKPGNVLVDRHGTVKVLDFGLAITTSTDKQTETGKAEGTIAYMAPELFASAPTVQSDLYAVGIMAYELFAGVHPFRLDSFMALVKDIIGKPPDLSLIPPHLAPFVQRLTAKRPDARPQSATQTIEELYRTLDLPAPDESITIRESFLQASTFVGRTPELDTFKTALRQLKATETSSAWVLGGESGSGKSRLVEEVRVRALVEGVGVLRGQAAAGGAPYQVWRDVLRPLVLKTELSDLEAGILKEVVPDIALLLKRHVPDVPTLAGPANQGRLALTVVDIFKRQEQPLLVVLEDLHWAENSLPLLRRLLNGLNDLRVMIIGTYRTDEAPELANGLPGMQKLQLERLDSDAIHELSRSILGTGADDPQLQTLLTKETEGNVFFLVEVVRALAEEAGSLRDIGKTELPQRVIAGGIQQVLRRRLGRMPDWSQQLLKLAAVAGRQLDRSVLTAASPQPNIEAFITAGANSAVFDVVDGNWRFAHDKLREAVLDDLSAEERPTLHRQVAEAIEAAYPNDDTYAERLADLWDVAGDAQKALQNILIVSRRMVDFTAEFARAQEILNRGLELIETLDATLYSAYYARLNGLLGRVEQRQGNLDLALACFQKSYDAAKQAESYKIPALLSIANVQWQQGRFDDVERHAQQVLKLSERLEDEVGKSDGLRILGELADMQGNYAVALDLYQQSLLIARTLQRPLSVAQLLVSIGLSHIQLGAFDEADKNFREALSMQRVVGDRLNIAITLGNLGYVALLKQDYDRAEAHVLESLKIKQEIGSPIAQAVTLISLSEIATARQDYGQALQHLKQSIAIHRTAGYTPGLVQALNEQAHVYLLLHDTSRAASALSESLGLSGEMQSTRYLLTVIILIARLYAHQAAYGRSIQLITFCESQAELAVIDRERYLEPLQKELQSSLSDAEYQVSVEAGRQYTLRKLVDELHIELSAMLPSAPKGNSNTRSNGNAV